MPARVPPARTAAPPDEPDWEAMEPPTDMRSTEGPPLKENSCVTRAYAEEAYRLVAINSPLKNPAGYAARSICCPTSMSPDFIGRYAKEEGRVLLGLTVLVMRKNA